MDGVHDMGGMDGFGPVVVGGVDEVFHDDWERRVFALNMLTGIENLRHNNGRATREEMDPAAYLAASYYERWLYSTEVGLVDAGVLTQAELDDWSERIRAGEPVPTRHDLVAAARHVEVLQERHPLPQPEAPRFAPGDRVRVSRMRPRAHTRCPRYVRGATGVVDRIQCADRLPDLRPANVVEAVYAVSFRSTDLFGDTGEAPFAVLLDLWESYLEKDGS